MAGRSVSSQTNALPRESRGGSCPPGFFNSVSYSRVLPIPLTLAAPTIAIDLPLKILIWEDAQKKVWVSYNSPEYLQQRHGFPRDLLANIAVAGTLAQKAAE